MTIQFPRSLKLMQSFLGEALFFKSFVPHYSDLTASLHDMTRKDFNWSDKSTWDCDYESIFETFKIALSNSLALYYPEYEWPWLLRVDASDIACGAILLQVRPSDGALLPINISSQKFSGAAQRWSTMEKRGLRLLLRYQVVMTTSSAGKSLSSKQITATLSGSMRAKCPKIIRWRVYMQSFHFTIRHIRGTLNTIADYLSRMYTIDYT
jgi:hypothetical protein